MGGISVRVKTNNRKETINWSQEDEDTARALEASLKESAAIGENAEGCKLEETDWLKACKLVDEETARALEASLMEATALAEAAEGHKSEELPALSEEVVDDVAAVLVAQMVRQELGSPQQDFNSQSDDVVEEAESVSPVGSVNDVDGTDEATFDQEFGVAPSAQDLAYVIIATAYAKAATKSIEGSMAEPKTLMD